MSGFVRPSQYSSASWSSCVYCMYSENDGTARQIPARSRYRRWCSAGTVWIFCPIGEGDSKVQNHLFHDDDDEEYDDIRTMTTKISTSPSQIRRCLPIVARIIVYQCGQTLTDWRQVTTGTIRKSRWVQCDIDLWHWWPWNKTVKVKTFGRLCINQMKMYQLDD